VIQVLPERDLQGLYRVRQGEDLHLSTRILPRQSISVTTDVAVPCFYGSDDYAKPAEGYPLTIHQTIEARIQMSFLGLWAICHCWYGTGEISCH
jgi:hypothetical protein